MVSRLNRNSPLPTQVGGQVSDNAIQRVLDTIITPLQAVLEFLQPYVQPEKWKPLPFQSDWSSYAATDQIAQYKKDPLGRVWVRGCLKALGARPSGDPIAVLPVGYRPPARLSFLVWTATGAVGDIEVTADGRINHLAGTTAHISVNFSFDTEA